MRQSIYVVSGLKEVALSILDCKSCAWASWLYKMITQANKQ